MGCPISKHITVYWLRINAQTFQKMSPSLIHILRSANYVIEDKNKVVLIIPVEYPELLDQVLDETMFSRNIVQKREIILQE